MDRKPIKNRSSAFVRTRSEQNKPVLIKACLYTDRCYDEKSSDTASMSRQNTFMKNIQVIDGAINADYAIYAVTEEEFALIFPGERQDIEFVEDLVDRLGDQRVYEIMAPVWNRAISKRDVVGLHGTLFYGLAEKKKYYINKREPVIDDRLIEGD